MTVSNLLLKCISDLTPCRTVPCLAVPFSLAQKNMHKCVTLFEQERWRDMGAVFLAIAAYTEPDGRLCIDPYDKIAETMNVPSPTFLALHKDKMDEIKRLLMDYVKNLRDQRSKTFIDQNNDGTAGKQISTNWEVKISDSGYPILPSIGTLDVLRKGELDIIVRTFLGSHYSAFSITFILTFIQTSIENWLRGKIMPCRIKISNVIGAAL